MDVLHPIDGPIRVLFHITKIYKKKLLLNIPGFMIPKNKSNTNKILVENVLDLKVDVND